MTIYADTLVLVNLYIDFFLLWCVKKTLSLRVKGRRLVLGAGVGGLCALSALLPLPRPAMLALGVFTAILVSCAAFLPLSLPMLFKASACFWVYSFLLAGFFLFLLTFFAPSGLAVVGNAIYFRLSPALLFFFTLGAYVLLWLFRRLFPPSSSRCAWLTLRHMGKEVRLFAKGDTGNALREPFSGLPVIVCEAEAVASIAPPEAASFLSGASPPSLPGLRLVPFSAMGSEGILPAFLPEEILLEKENRPIAAYLALYPGKLSQGQFNALYNPDSFPQSSSHSQKGG